MSIFLFLYWLFFREEKKLKAIILQKFVRNKVKYLGYKTQIIKTMSGYLMIGDFFMFTFQRSVWDRTIFQHNRKKCRKTDIAHLKNRMYPRLHNSLTVRDNPIKTRITLVFLKILGHPIWNYCFYLCRISVVKYRLFFTHSGQNGYKFTEKICNSFVYFKDIWICLSNIFLYVSLL